MAEYQSPGGFVFGVQGWDWGEQRPKAITFKLDGTAGVFDQHGRPIKGAVVDGVEAIYFDKCTHAQTVAALAAEHVDWKKLTWAGWPQLPYDQLRGLPLPPEPAMTDRDTFDLFLGQLRKIRDPQARKDALRYAKEVWEVRAKELQLATEED